MPGHTTRTHKPKLRHNRNKRPSNHKKKKDRRKKQVQKTVSKPIATKSSPSLALPIVTNQPAPKDQAVIVADFNSVSPEEFISAAAAVNKMEDPAVSSVAISNSNQPAVGRVAQIAAPVVGVFGGIVLIAAAMFYVARKRKRNSIVVAPAQNDEDDENKLQDISLSSDSEGEDDEAIAMKKNQPPMLTPALREINILPMQYNQQGHHYYQHQYLKHFHNYQQHQVTEQEQDQTTTHSSDYQSMNNTLVASRTNSVATSHTKKHTPLPAFSPKPSLRIPRPQSRASSWRSSGSSVYTDALVSPTSTVVSPRVSTFIMVAERQQLQHERPSILDHYGEIKSSRSTPIETYKAQLSPIVNPNEGDEENGVEDTCPGDIPLPFFNVTDIQQEIFI